MRVQGVSKEKNGVSAASEGPSGSGCNKQCAKGCGTKARLAHKQAINQKMAERNLQNVKSSNTNSAQTVNNSSTKKNTPKQKSVDDVVKYIEGNSAGSDKKKMKKERQKQEKIKVLKEQEEKERKIQEAIAREEQRVKEEERKRAEAEKAMSQMSKKQLKKANQRAKKLAEEQGTSYSPLSLTKNQVLSQVPGAFGKTESSMLHPNLSMEQLKAKHQREMEMMELKHKQALEEEYVRSMYKQNGQTLMQPQYQQPRYQPQASPSFGSLGSLGGLGSSAGGLGSSLGGLGGLGGLGSSLGNLGSTRSPSSPLSSLEDLKAQLNSLTTNTMNQLRSGLMKSSLTGNTDDNGASNTRFNLPTKTSDSTLQNVKQKNKKGGNTNNVSKSNDSNGSQGPRSSLPAGAKEALAKVGNNPDNQIRISRNAQGGVDFTPVPSNQAKAR